QREIQQYLDVISFINATNSIDDLNIIELTTDAFGPNRDFLKAVEKYNPIIIPV
ncbi:2932_t:CDS:2, partial [Racocetra persica]